MLSSLSAAGLFNSVVGTLTAQQCFNQWQLWLAWIANIHKLRKSASEKEITENIRKRKTASVGGFDSFVFRFTRRDIRRLGGWQQPRSASSSRTRWSSFSLILMNLGVSNAWWYVLFHAIYLQELSDFAVEIDILHEFSHKNIIKLYDAFFHDTKLWVSAIVFGFCIICYFWLKTVISSSKLSFAVCYLLDLEER